MSDEPDLAARAGAVEQKVEALSASLDGRFDAVDTALVEVREYTELAFTELRREMLEGFSRVDERFEQADGRFRQIDTHLMQIDSRFEQVDRTLLRLDDRFARVDGRLDALERTLNRFIDTQTKSNALVERRLRSLERGRPNGRGPGRQ